MHQWITRRTAAGIGIAPPQPCYPRGAIEAIPGVLSIEEYVAAQLRSDEICANQGERRAIIRGREYVGYFEITPDRPAQ
ncbi:MAG TPA: hypothetical protein VFZ95_15455 [Steroidobacteraceae bacterium]